MKDIIMLVIDAYCYDILKHKIGSQAVTPFLNELAEKSLVLDKMYSQAPYTEAALVSLLSGENTLDHGGYLMGNGTVAHTIFELMKTKGYKTISQYSPYVYSKAYLRGVDEFFYTRLYNFDILVTYRLKYYAERKNNLSNHGLKICILLLNEAFDTWIEQIERMLQNSIECSLIHFWKNEHDLNAVYKDLVYEKNDFYKDSEKYTRNLLENLTDHRLVQLNKIYNKRLIDNLDYLKRKYNLRLSEFQKKYSKNIYRNKPDINYILSVSRESMKKAKQLLLRYKDYYQNQWLADYLNNIQSDTKVEACITRQFEYILDKINIENGNGNSVFAYLQVQDFHLPSLFHSFESKDTKTLDNEFEQAFKLLEQLDNNYQGNILADLSAHYIDNAIKKLFQKLVEIKGENFELIITADHGFPAFYMPPRTQIYNQRYLEAFHIPFIWYSGENGKKREGFFSGTDIYKALDKGKNFFCQNNQRDYILCEYGGPGCPDIGKRLIWYTYIDQDYSVSFECSLHESITRDSIVELYDLKKDWQEKKNLYKSLYNERLVQIIKIVNNRHQQLRNDYEKDFEECILSYFVDEKFPKIKPF